MITPEQVHAIAQLAGVTLPPELLPRVAAAYNALLPGITELQTLDVAEAAPAAVIQIPPGQR